MVTTSINDPSQLFSVETKVKVGCIYIQRGSLKPDMICGLQSPLLTSQQGTYPSLV